MDKVKIENCKKSVIKHRSGCPISVALDLLGDKWSLLIIRDLIKGKSTFGDLLKSPEGIASNILANRLNKLVSVGLIQRQQQERDKRKIYYSLTNQGKRLEPIISELKHWSEGVNFE